MKSRGESDGCKESEGRDRSITSWMVVEVLNNFSEYPATAGIEQ